MADDLNYREVAAYIKRYGLNWVIQAIKNQEENDLHDLVNSALSIDRELLAAAEIDTVDVSAIQRGFTRVSRGRLKKLLPYEWKDEYEKELLDRFDGCALTSAKSDVQFDHFIPISWGQGGTYLGNVIPIAKDLNRDKDNQNPFEWIKKPKIRKLVNLERWDRLVKYLADLHGLTTDEFERFVYWCSENRRDGSNALEFTSLHIWKAVCS